jgi:hypothetical protein
VVFASILSTHYHRFSQDMSLINQALPMVLLNFAIGTTAIGSLRTCDRRS